MSQKQFNLNSLIDLDGGKAHIAANHAINQVVKDIIDRYGDKAKRKVLVEMTFVPVLDRNLAVLDTIDVDIKIKTSVPVRQTTAYPMLPTKDGALMFSPESPHDPRQSSLFRKGETPEGVTEDGEVVDGADDTAQL